MADLKAALPIALVVEDDPLLRKLATLVLEDVDLEVIEAVSAEEALAVLRDRGDHVRLLFTDVRLPGHVSGLQLAQTASVMWPEVRILLTSGTSPSRLEELPQTVTFLIKPWRNREVAAVAQKAIRA
jgi:DNA-binding NtrC family response regulator